MTDTLASGAGTDDLGAVRPAAAPPARKAVFAGYTASQLLLGVLVLALLVWSIWVTHELRAKPPQRIVRANLSRIVGDYVQAQARSATPPADVQSEMRRFMASLDQELQRRSAGGQVVLVGEAVLSKEVPDITGDVLAAVYASGVRKPQPASAAEMGQMLRSSGAVQNPAQPMQAAKATPMLPPDMLPTSPSMPAGSPLSMDAPIPSPMTGVAESGLGGSDGIARQ